MSELVLGPALRYAGETEALIWVETDAACTVTVLGRDARTFCFCGHHYALVKCDGLEPGTITPYEVALDGEKVWPLPGSELPPSVVRTHDPNRPTRIVFGSCRVCVPHEPPYSLPKDKNPEGRRRLQARAGGGGRLGHPRRLRLQGRPRGRGDALELLPRHRPGASRDGRLARRPGARGRAQHGGRGGVALDRGARPRRLRAPAHRHLAAAAARAGDALPRGVERGGVRGRVGAGRRATGRSCARPSTSSTGPRSASRSSG